MRPLVLGALTLCGAACIPDEPWWLVQDARLVGVRLSVVEPGGYSTLLNVPEGQRRATPLPLDTVELEWLVAAAPDAEVQPPIWLGCAALPCTYSPDTDPREWPACPSPLTFDQISLCRLGEGERLRVGLGGAFSFGSTGWEYPGITTLIFGSRSPDVSPTDCLARYFTSPRQGLEGCLIGVDVFSLGPPWALLPFSDDLAMLPPELLLQEADTHPDVVGFRVTRERGARRIEVLAAPDDTVEVEPGERITVLPLLIGGGAQDYIIVGDADGDGPMPPEATVVTESLGTDARLTALVEDFESPTNLVQEVRWTVPEDPEPAILYVDVHDGRAGTGFAALRFTPAAP